MYGCVMCASLSLYDIQSHVTMKVTIYYCENLWHTCNIILFFSKTKLVLQVSVKPTKQRAFNQKI